MGTIESSPYNPPNTSAASRNRSHPSEEERRQRKSSVGSPSRSMRRQRLLPIVTLNGLVLGLTGSGKRTLLQRLEGKDPFVVVDENGNDEDAPHDIVVPYKPPTDATVWDRIQLSVQIKLNENVATDFCVILVNPRHDARSLQPYIARLVTLLLKQSQISKRKLCLCFLLNFRDLQEGNRDGDATIQCKDVQEWAEEILEKHNKSTTDQRVVLQCLETSLKNCYGLNSLHYFIYQSYLVHKQVELEQRLSEVQAQLDKSKQVPSMTYDAFLKVLAQTKAAETTPSQGRQTSGSITQSSDISANLTSGVENRKVRERDRQTTRSTVSTEERTEERQRVDQRRTQRGPPTSRTIMPKANADPKQTLDAFFADDDDSESEIATPVTSHHAPKTNESDDEDDDDFFYDEGGQRHQHGHVVYDSISDDDDEEDESIASRGSSFAGSIDSQLEEARGHSILDSEDSSVLEEESVDVVQQPRVQKESPKSSKRNINDVSDGNLSAEDELEVDGDEDGWDHDDLDLGDSDDDKDVGNGGSAGADDKRRTADAIEVENAKGSDNQDEEGMKTNDLCLESNTEPQQTDVASSKEVKASIGEKSLNRTETGQNEASTCESENMESAAEDPGQNQQIGAATINVSNGESPTKTDSSNDTNDRKPVPNVEADQHDSDVDKVIRKKAFVVPESLSGPTEKDDDDDDDDFVVEETSTSTHLSPMDDSLVQNVQKEKVETSSSPSSTPGLSAAAMAAIAAAEREAQLMMQEPTAPVAGPSVKMEKKKSKKKKDPDAKKKKKRHKEKRSSQEAAER